MTRIVHILTTFIISVAAVAGGVGGCTIAAYRLLSDKKLPIMFLAAYIFVGAVFGVLGVVVTKILTGIYIDFERTMLFSFIFGVTGAASLASMSFSARFLLQRLGIEVIVDVHRKEKK